MSSLSSASCSSEKAIGDIFAARWLTSNNLRLLSLVLFLWRGWLLSLGTSSCLLDAQRWSILMVLIRVGLSLLSLNLFVNEGADVGLGLATDIAIFVVLSICSGLISSE